MAESLSSRGYVLVRPEYAKYIMSSINLVLLLRSGKMRRRIVLVGYYLGSKNCCGCVNVVDSADGCGEKECDIFKCLRLFIVYF